MCVIGPRGACRLWLIKQILGVILLIGMVVFLPIFSNSWESGFDADEIFIVILSVSFLSVCMIGWLGLALFCQSHFRTLSYWTSHLTRKAEEFPQNERERNAEKLWALLVYETKESTYIQAHIALQVEEIDCAASCTSLEEQDVKLQHLVCLQYEVEQWKRELDEAEEFFFGEWPRGSRILDEDDRNGGRPPEWETEPESPVIDRVMV